MHSPLWQDLKGLLAGAFSCAHHLVKRQHSCVLCHGKFWESRLFSTPRLLPACLRASSLLPSDISGCESVSHSLRGHRSRSLSSLTKVSAAGKKEGDITPLSSLLQRFWGSSTPAILSEKIIFNLQYLFCLLQTILQTVSWWLTKSCKTKLSTPLKSPVQVAQHLTSEYGSILHLSFLNSAKTQVASQFKVL